MAKVLITGAGRGIGLELTRQYVEAGDEVIACVRDPAGSEGLSALAAGGKVSIVQMDMGDFPSIERGCAEIGDQAIDIAILNAGAMGGMKQGIDDVDIAEWHRTLDVNTIGPLLCARGIKDNLAASGDGKLMLVSSQLAASTWPMGGMLIYSTTKAALSKVGQVLNLDWKDLPITTTVMHPGWVQTDMGGPNAAITAEESASGIRAVLAEQSPADSGKFYKWNGEIHPW